MRRGRTAIAVGLGVALAGCAPSIRELNLRPERHYQEKTSVKGRITRMQSAGGDTVLELADAQESRILVTVRGPVAQQIGDWVSVTGVLVPEARVGDQSLYDVVAAEDVSSARAPLFPNLF